MNPQLAATLSYICLGLSALILCGSLWVLKRARKHIHGVRKMAEPWWFKEKQDTLILPEGYHDTGVPPKGYSDE
jgi:hypothetical protein